MPNIVVQSDGSGNEVTACQTITAKTAFYLCEGKGPVTVRFEGMRYGTLQGTRDELIADKGGEYCFTINADNNCCGNKVPTVVCSDPVLCCVGGGGGPGGADTEVTSDVICDPATDTYHRTIKVFVDGVETSSTTTDTTISCSAGAAAPEYFFQGVKLCNALGEWTVTHVLEVGGSDVPVDSLFIDPDGVITTDPGDLAECPPETFDVTVTNDCTDPVGTELCDIGPDAQVILDAYFQSVVDAINAKQDIEIITTGWLCSDVTDTWVRTITVFIDGVEQPSTTIDSGVSCDEAAPADVEYTKVQKDLCNAGGTWTVVHVFEVGNAVEVQSIYVDPNGAVSTNPGDLVPCESDLPTGTCTKSQDLTLQPIVFGVPSEESEELISLVSGPTNDVRAVTGAQINQLNTSSFSIGNEFGETLAAGADSLLRFASSPISIQFEDCYDTSATVDLSVTVSGDNVVAPNAPSDGTGDGGVNFLNPNDNTPSAFWGVPAEIVNGSGGPFTATATATVTVQDIIDGNVAVGLGLQTVDGAGGLGTGIDWTGTIDVSVVNVVASTCLDEDFLRVGLTDCDKPLPVVIEGLPEIEPEYQIERYGSCLDQNGDGSFHDWGWVVDLVDKMTGIPAQTTYYTKDFSTELASAAISEPCECRCTCNPILVMSTIEATPLLNPEGTVDFTVSNTIEASGEVVPCGTCSRIEVYTRPVGGTWVLYEEISGVTGDPVSSYTSVLTDPLDVSITNNITPASIMLDCSGGTSFQLDKEQWAIDSGYVGVDSVEIELRTFVGCPSDALYSTESTNTTNTAKVCVVQHARADNDNSSTNITGGTITTTAQSLLTADILGGNGAPPSPLNGSWIEAFGQANTFPNRTESDFIAILNNQCFADPPANTIPIPVLRPTEHEDNRDNTYVTQVVLSDGSIIPTNSQIINAGGINITGTELGNALNATSLFESFNLRNIGATDPLAGPLPDCDSRVDVFFIMSYCSDQALIDEFRIERDDPNILLSDASGPLNPAPSYMVYKMHPMPELDF